MAAAPQSPPEIPAIDKMSIPNQQQRNQPTNNTETEEDMNSQIPIRSPQPAVQVSNSQPTESKKKSTKPAEVRRTESQKNNHQAEESSDTAAESHDDPHESLEDFDWDEFNTRYSQAMIGASQDEQALREEFSRLVQYFGVWASAASQYDNDRSSKRIKTRALYVQNAEHSLEKKKQHYTQVVQAFQNALALLGGT